MLFFLTSDSFLYSFRAGKLIVKISSVFTSVQFAIFCLRENVKSSLWLATNQMQASLPNCNQHSNLVISKEQKDAFSKRIWKKTPAKYWLLVFCVLTQTAFPQLFAGYKWRLSTNNQLRRMTARRGMFSYEWQIDEWNLFAAANYPENE